MEKEHNSSLPDYRPDKGSLFLFRRMGRLGTAISLVGIVSLAYEVYITASYYRLMNQRLEGYFATVPRLRTEYAVRFFSLLSLSVIGLISIFLLLKASRSLLQYGSDHNNIDIGRPAKYLYTWFICLLANVIVNALYVSYVFMSTNDMIR